jgi:cobalt-precorrin-5B (C1)-methyltransferase
MVELRTGYTTGTCAAAAAKAAAVVLCGGQLDGDVTVELPDGTAAAMRILYTKLQGNNAVAAVRKDAGDDPDITDKAVIQATVRFNGQQRIVFYAGDGVGTVTKAGLQIAIGEPAINSVPREMIVKAIQAVTQKGVDVTISVPGGKELAAKTFNPKLGIVGGISIIGTSGKVRPFSVPALREALKCSLDIAQAAGITSVVYVPGHIGKRAASALFSLKEDQIVEVSNEWGYMLDCLAEYRFEKLLVLGHPGKLAKLAEGNWDTHSSNSPSAVPFINALAERTIGKQFPEAVTVEGLFESLDSDEKALLGGVLAEAIRNALARRINWAEAAVATVIVNMKGDRLGEAGDIGIWK